MPDDQEAVTGGGTRTVRSRLIQVGKVAVTVVLLGAVGWALHANWDSARQGWAHLTWGTVCLSGLAVLAGLLASSVAWRDSVRDIGTPVGLAASARVFIIGQLAKYVPGTVWVYLLQTELGRRAGVPRARAFLGSLTAMAVGIAAALVVGVAGLTSAVTDSADYGGSYAHVIRVGYLAALALCPVALACLVPRVLTTLVSVALRLMRRPPLDRPLTWGGILRVFGWSVVTWVCYGLHVWLLVETVADPGLAGLGQCVGACAIAVSLAMFFPTPSGVGGREAALAALVVPLLAGPDAFGVALGVAGVSRVVFTVAEAVGAGLAALTDLPAWRSPVGRGADGRGADGPRTDSGGAG